MLTDAQKDFFKNSKVRDDQNNLISVFHGSKAKGFSEFRYDPNNQTGTNYGEAYYFTSDYIKAEGYSYDPHKDPRIKEYQEKKQELIQKWLKTQDPEDKQAIFDLRVDGMTLNEMMNADFYHYDTGGEVIEAYLNIENPLIVDADGMIYSKVYPDYFKEARECGHDGIIIHNVVDIPRGEPWCMDVYIAFKPNQIKSISNFCPTKSNNFRDNAIEYYQNKPMTLDDKINMAKSKKTDKVYTNEYKSKDREL